MEAAVQREGLVIPLIDFSAFLNGNPEQRRETAKAILHGFQTAGFIYLKGLPITSEYRKHVFETSAKYFRLPTETKMSHCWTTPEANRGYSAPGREKTTSLTDREEVQRLRDTVPDIKESLEIGREDEPGHPNHWPEEEGELVGFKETMLGFHTKCKELHIEVMRAIAVGLQIEETWFDDYTDVGDNTLRLLHYPEVRKDVFRTNPSQVRAGAHSDYGSITLLFQDARGGLQVRSPTGVFVDATPIEDTCVVNAGDLLARWSNDNIKSTIHRVVEPPSRNDEDTYGARYSIAYFCNPNFKSYIEAIPGTYAAEADRKYEGINSGQYLVQRLTATY
ncbi:thymine dioxygenase [Durotheca rogersii]|uniref:thymine dioxygenase n=1 Tax=Durotheca rogersii TaxID=419775 RepID=UPI002220ACEA|nr:thymine dioxygenase [Durotheca rogersii]KAI5862292.1 thymine dioxygenase [Durotheca rogersii]